MKILITTSKHTASFQLASLLKNDEVLFGDYFADFPPANSNSLAHQILKFCLDHQIEKVFPLVFTEAAELKKSLVLFDEFNIEIMLGADAIIDVNHADKSANSFAELSSGLIALGYPANKIAISNAEGRGELILIDDAVKDNLQIWNQVKSVSFNQLGKWFNQADFQSVFLYQLNEELRQVFVLIEGKEFIAFENLDEDVSESLKSVIENTNLKGFYHIAISNEKVLRIVNTTL